MDEKDIELLLALEKTNSITHAAQLLFVNQSSLSKRIKLLERKLNTTLFIRSKTGVCFTQAGKEAWATAKKIQQLTSDLKEQLHTEAGMINGTLNLGCSIDFAQFKLPELLAAFHQKYPAAKLTITTDYSRQVYQQLIDNEIELGIIRGEFSSATLKKKLIAVDQVYLICREAVSLEDLKHMPFISRKSDYAFKDEMNHWLIENQLYALDNQVMVVDNLISCVEFVRQGLGWALVPGIALANFDGYQKALTFQDGQSFNRKTYLMYRDISAQTPTNQAFIELFKGNEPNEKHDDSQNQTNGPV